MSRDPRPWQHALAALPECFTVTAFEWWHNSDRPNIQLCVFGHDVSMKPAWTSPGYSVYRGRIDATEWIERAFIPDDADNLACVIVTRLQAAALLAVAPLIRGVAA